MMVLCKKCYDNTEKAINFPETRGFFFNFGWITYKLAGFTKFVYISVLNSDQIGHQFYWFDASSNFPHMPSEIIACEIDLVITTPGENKK